MTGSCDVSEALARAWQMREWLGGGVQGKKVEDLWTRVLPGI